MIGPVQNRYSITYSAVRILSPLVRHPCAEAPLKTHILVSAAKSRDWSTLTEAQPSAPRTRCTPLLSVLT